MSIVKNGKYYFYDFVHEGKRYRKSCRTTDKKLAEQVEISVKNDIIKQEHNLPSARNKNLLFQAAWESYLKNSGNTEKTIRSKIDSGKHILPVFQNKSLGRISSADIKNYQLERKLEVRNRSKNMDKREGEINYRSVNIELATLHHFFNYCMERDYIQSNPASRIKKLNELSRLKTLSDGDIKKLITGATNKLTRDIITFLIYTGCRKGEALNLKWDDVDMKNGVIAVKGTKTKFDRYIPISEALRGVLEGIERNQGLHVFNNNGAKLTDFKRSFKTACRNAGLKDLRIHDLRHVFASKMVMNGTSLYITGELLGHRTPNMTKRYSHLVPDTLKKAVNEVWSKEK